MKSFFSPLCIRESKGSDCTLLMCSISFAFVSSVIQRAGVCLRERGGDRKGERANFYYQELSQFMLSLVSSVGVMEVFVASLKLPFI